MTIRERAPSFAAAGLLVSVLGCGGFFLDDESHLRGDRCHGDGDRRPPPEGGRTSADAGRPRRPDASPLATPDAGVPDAFAADAFAADVSPADVSPADTFAADVSPADALASDASTADASADDADADADDADDDTGDDTGDDAADADDADAAAADAEVCPDGQCPCRRDEDCASEQVCDVPSGECRPRPLTCSEILTEDACLAREDCEPIYGGRNCTDRNGGQCTAGDVDCTCAIFTFAVCASVTSGP